jgi:hypothetical protein
MPEWLGPALNSTALATIVGFVLWAITRAAKFLAPKITSIVEGHVTTMDRLGEAAVRQTDLMSRQTSMLDDHSQTLNVHGTILNVHSEQLRNITEAVGAKRVAMSMPSDSQRPNSKMTIQPGVEVDSAGHATPVVVATEVIRQPSEPQNPKPSQTALEKPQ